VEGGIQLPAGSWIGSSKGIGAGLADLGAEDITAVKVHQFLRGWNRNIEDIIRPDTHLTNEFSNQVTTSAVAESNLKHGVGVG
jgi:hypothetical protein